jgi:hypothetical protein
METTAWHIYVKTRFRDFPLKGTDRQVTMPV